MLYLCSSPPSSIDMEPTTAAGIGLAVMSLAAQSFTGTMQGMCTLCELFPVDEFQLSS